MVAQNSAPHILIADTEQTNCRVFEAKLTRHASFRVVSVNSALDGMQAVIQNVFALILWDIHLRDSTPMLPRLRAMCPDAALILMTTDDRPELDPEFALLDVSDTLIKPFNLETLVEKVHLALTRSPVERVYPRLDLARIGQQIALYTENGVCATRVLDYRQDSILVTGAPRVQAPEGMTVGQHVQVHIQGQDALYCFRSRIARQHALPVPCWELLKPRVIHREQRRKHTRHPLRLRVSVLPMSKPDSETTGAESSRSIPGATEQSPSLEYTADVSLGGCAITTAQPLSIGESVRLVFHSGKEKTYSGEGRVVRIQPVVPAANASSDLFRLGVRFTELNTAARRFLRDRLQPGEFFTRLPE